MNTERIRDLAAFLTVHALAPCEAKMTWMKRRTVCGIDLHVAIGRGWVERGTQTPVAVKGYDEAGEADCPACGEDEQ